MKKPAIVILLCLTNICLSGQPEGLPIQLVKMDSLLNGLNNYRSADLTETGLLLVRQYKDTIVAYGDSISMRYAHALYREAEFEGMEGQLTQGIPLLNESISILTTIQKTESPLYVLATYSLAQNSLWLGEFTEAEKWFRQSMATQEKLSGKENNQYLNSLKLLGQLKALSSDFPEAEMMLNEAIAISIQVNGKDSEQTSSVHTGLAILYAESGDPEKALPHFVENLRITEINVGKDHEHYAVSLMQVGICYLYMGMPGLAEEYFLQCLSFYQTKGINTLSQLAKGNYISLLSNIASNYDAMGKYEKALPIVLEVDSFCMSPSGNFLVCRGFGLVKGNVLSYLGYKAEAESAYLDYKQYILDETGRTDNPQFGKALTNLAIDYYQEGSYEKARLMLEESCAIFTNLYGKANEKYLSALGALGMTYLHTGDTLQALGIFQNIEKTARDSIPTGSTDFYSLMNAMSKFYHSRKDSAAATYYQELMLLLPKQYQEATQLFSEREFLASDHKYVRDIHRFQSYLLDHPAEQTLYGLEYNVAIQTKSIYLDNRLKLQAQIQQADSSTQTLYNVWKKLQLQLYDSYSENMPDSLSTIKLENSIDSMEVHLLKNIPGLSDLKTSVSWHDIESTLHPEEAAIEISRVPYYNPGATNLVYYSASIILPGHSTPVFIPLCEEDELAAILSYNPDNKKASVNSLYTFAFQGQPLYNLIWKPIQPYLNGIKKIYISPDGLFHRIQLAAVPVNDKQIVDDVYDLTILTSTRELVDPNPASVIHHQSESTAAVFGGLIYDETPTDTPDQTSELSLQVRGEMDELETDTSFRKSPWPYLPFSAKEADDINVQLSNQGYSVNLYSGLDGTEIMLKEEGRPIQDHISPNIIHISTHGFFFPQPDQSKLIDQSNDDYVFKLSNHSMLRCGLLFSGVNPYWVQTKEANSSNEGILTAYEISQLNLEHTDLVILSACETGLGDIKGTEGVFGLQRAFKIAGAKQIISSLWQVPDFQTYELMDLFYKGYLEESLSSREALKYARDKMRKKRYEPFYWAGFVLLE